MAAKKTAVKKAPPRVLDVDDRIFCLEVVSRCGLTRSLGQASLEPNCLELQRFMLRGDTDTRRRCISAARDAMVSQGLIGWNQLQPMIETFYDYVSKPATAENLDETAS